MIFNFFKQKQTLFVKAYDFPICLYTKMLNLTTIPFLVQMTLLSKYFNFHTNVLIRSSVFS